MNETGRERAELIRRMKAAQEEIDAANRTLRALAVKVLAEKGVEGLQEFADRVGVSPRELMVPFEETA